MLLADCKWFVSGGKNMQKKKNKSISIDNVIYAIECG